MTCVRSPIADARFAPFAAPFAAGIAFRRGFLDVSACCDVGNHYSALMAARRHVLFTIGCIPRAIFRLTADFSAARNTRGFARANHRTAMRAIAFARPIYYGSVAVIAATSISSSLAVPSPLGAFSRGALLAALSAALRARLCCVPWYFAILLLSGQRAIHGIYIHGLSLNALSPTSSLGCSRLSPLRALRGLLRRSLRALLSVAVFSTWLRAATSVTIIRHRWSHGGTFLSLSVAHFARFFV